MLPKLLTDKERSKTTDVFFFYLLSSESRVMELTSLSFFLLCSSLEKASESDQDPGHLNHPVHLGRLCRVCDNPCRHLQIH